MGVWNGVGVWWDGEQVWVQGRQDDNVNIVITVVDHT
jgi:hypothetical protein